jgi:hypothetical protein
MCGQKNHRLKVTKLVLGRPHTKETGNRKATAISKKYSRFQAGNWFPN